MAVNPRADDMRADRQGRQGEATVHVRAGAAAKAHNLDDGAGKPTTAFRRHHAAGDGESALLGYGLVRCCTDCDKKQEGDEASLHRDSVAAMDLTAEPTNFTRRSLRVAHA